MKKRGFLLGSMCALLVLCCGVVAVNASTASGQGDTGQGDTGQGDSKRIERGHYLVRAGDCAGCHTVRGGKPFAGHRAIATPFGNIYAPNITPDRVTGIGDWSADDFWDALHEGVGRDGQLLYPAFPYPSYTQITRKDADAMFAYLQTLDPVHSKTPEPELSFPYSWRKLLLGWRALYFDKGVYKQHPDKSAQWNRGAYLVQGLGHCNACHTPRNALGATRSSKHLRGGMLSAQGWLAPDLGSGSGGGLEDWSTQDIVDLLSTGRSARGTVYGPMAEVVQNSLQHLKLNDVQAIAMYLHDLPRHNNQRESTQVQPSRRQRMALLDAGKKIYRKRCAACHQDHGGGVAQVYPPLAGNSLVLANNPVNPIRVVLLGGFEPTTTRYPRPYSMPAFMQRLSDDDVAAVVSYIRNAWGNKAAAVSPKTVAKYRTVPAD